MGRASENMEGVEKRDDHPQDEWGVKQQADGSESDNEGEETPAPAGTKSDRVTDGRTLHRHSRALDDEVKGRETVAAACWQGDHALVNESGDHKDEERRDWSCDVRS